MQQWLRPRLAMLAWGLALTTAASAAAPDIPFERFVLDNGLQVVVHTDRKAPIVAVNLWYRVGSKDEPAGRTGLAHLFEHLMFNGSEHHRGEFFDPFEQVGATDMNGTTNSDRTNYFETVPTTALDMALWMESDRMGHLLGAIDQKTLDEQRSVVKNEKRQGQNQPYGEVWEHIGRAMYPPGHPYRHSVIGSMHDLDAATLDDVKQWFRAWYGPNNGVLVLAGDIDAATAKRKAIDYFGHIPASPTLPRHEANIPRRPADTRQTVSDAVPQTRLYLAWNVPQAGTGDLDRLQLLAQVLGGGGASRLDARLRHGERLVDDIGATVQARQLASNFIIVATVKQGVDPARVEKILDEELRRLLHEGPSAAELERARTTFRAGFIRGIERVGGLGGKADVLAGCTVHSGDPGCFRTALANIDRAGAAELAATGRRWLGKGRHTLVVTPGRRAPLAEESSATPPAAFEPPPVDRRYRVRTAAVDRRRGVPLPTRFPELKFPALQRAKLKNGSELILARRPDIPVVQFRYEFKGGSASDPKARPGVAAFAMQMLGEGAGEWDALRFAERAETLGASLGGEAGLDGVSVALSALKDRLEPSLVLFATMLRQPRFDPDQIERVRASWIAAIAQEKAQPQRAAQRVLPPLLYGQGHPYAIPFSGTGTESAIRALDRRDLLDHHQTWLHPQGATLIVVGDTTLEEIVPLLDRHLGDWSVVDGAPPPTVVPPAPRPRRPRLFLIDQPGALQATIFAGTLTPSTRDPGALAFDVANAILGGEFSSRLNMNLREDKRWAYGAYSLSLDALGQRPWLALAPVQIDKTAEALQEMQRDISQYATGAKPATPAELARIQAARIRALPAAYETGAAVLGAIGGIVRYDRPDDWVFERKRRVEALTLEQVNAAAATLDPSALTWVVVGDLKRIEAPLRALKLADVSVLDADGRSPAAGGRTLPD